jgi:dolichyl-phosphate beta-glucosyltransferase
MPDVCLIVPCFNEEARLRRDDLLAFLQTHPGTTLCLVDDGSSDGTRAVLERLRQSAPEEILVLGLPQNRGKAEAVRQGVLHVAAQRAHALIGYWDADLSTPLSELARLRAPIDRSPSVRLAMGARVKRLGAAIERRAWRHVVGRVFATCASWLLRLPVYDSQCGAKLFRSEIAEGAFGEPFATAWLFDLEILARLRNQLGPEEVLRAVAEVPLAAWTDVEGSKLRMTDFCRVPLELLKIHARYNAGRFSRAPRALAP